MKKKFTFTWALIFGGILAAAVPGAGPAAGACAASPDAAAVAETQGSSGPGEAVKKKLNWKSKRDDKTEGLRIRDLAFESSPHLGLAFPGKFTQYFNVMSRAGIGIVRMAVPWSSREPQPGKYDWTGLDQAILTLNGLGMEAFLTLDSDAEWGVESTDLSARNRPPLDLAVWQNFVRKVVERYDHDGIDDAPGLQMETRYFQVANEWISENNASGGWSGTRDQLIAFINASHDAAKEASPGSIFVLGGIAAINLDVMVLTSGIADYTAVAGYAPDATRIITPDIINDPVAQAYVQEAYRVISETRYDVADLHLYGPVSYNDARITMLGQRIGGGIKLISSECGGPSRAYDEDGVITPQEHFLAVMDINLHALSRGLEFCLWLRLGESDTGVTWGNMEVPLFDLDRQPKGGYWAYMLLAAGLEDYKRVDRIQDGVYIIHREGMVPIFVAWATPGNTTYQLPVDAHPNQMLRVTNAEQGIYQVEVAPVGGLIQLTELPVIISENLPGGAYATGGQPDFAPLDAPNIN